MRHISRSELKRLMATPMPDPKVELARRMFIFSSLTGLAYADVYNLYPRHIGIPKAERKQQVLDILRKVRLSQRAKHYPQQLSGGQQQRVAIARAVVGKPMLILADEPTGNLDSKNSLEIMKLLSQLNAEGTTIVMVTHSQHDATYADRIINLFDGQIVDELEGKL